MPVAKRIPLLALVLLAGPARAFDWENYDVEDYEEAAGACVSFEGNPSDGIYGLSFGDGTWLKGTPVFSEFFISAFHNGLEEGLYGALGMTLRIMPHWDIAPFAGGGGSYSQSLARDEEEGTGGEHEDEHEHEDEAEEERGESYWAAHAEGGIRIGGAARFYELLGRFTWSASDIEDADYYLIRLSYGQRF